MQQWIDRAEELNSCVNCLTSWENGKDVINDHFICKHCGEGEWEEPRDELEAQYESWVKSLNTQLQEEKTITEKFKTQIEDLNVKISSLEGRLEEKEQELQKFDKLDGLCKEKEAELRRLWEQIGKKDFQLEQYKKTSALPSQSFSATEQQPCPTSPSISLEQTNVTNNIKTLVNLQDQQQKLTLIVSHLYKKIKTLDMSWLNYSSFNPIMGPYDTGQCFNKLYQV